MVLSGSRGGRDRVVWAAPVDYFAEISSLACENILPSMIGLAVSKNAATAGESLCRSTAGLVGRLLGRCKHRTTARYAHLSDAHPVEAAEKVGDIIDRAMEFRS